MDNNDNKKIFVEKKLNDDNESSLFSEQLEPKKNKKNNKDKVNIEKIFIGPKITEKDFINVTDYCNAKIKEKEKSMAKDIAEFVKNNLKKSGNEWFVFVLDNTKKSDTYDF